MKPARSMVLSMRLPVESGRRLKRIANRHGWTPSDASARLVEEGLRRSEFAFLDFRDSPAGRQAYMQGSTLAVWEVMFLLRSYKGNVAAVAKHLRWPEARVRAAINYAEAFPEEIDEATAENDSADFETLKRMLPQAVVFAWTSIFPRPWRRACDVAIGRWSSIGSRSGRVAAFLGRTILLV